MTSTCYQWQINKLLNSFLHTESEFQCTFLLMAHFDLNVKSSWEIFDLYFVVVWSLSHVQLFAIPWTGACQASLSITNSQSLLKLMSIESVMPSNHLFLSRPLLLLPSMFPSIGLFQWVSFLHQVAEVLELQLQHQSFQWIFSIYFL